MSSGGTAQKSWEYEVSGNYFDMLGVQPQVGRFFHASDEHGPNSAPYIVLSDALWRTRFNADPRVVGTTVDLNKHPFTIIGVAPKNFHGTEIFFWPEFWIPMVNEEQVEGYSFLTKRGNHGTLRDRLAKTRSDAAPGEDNLNAVAHQMTRENPTDDDGLAARLVKPGLLGDTLGGPATAVSGCNHGAGLAGARWPPASILPASLLRARQTAAANLPSAFPLDRRAGAFSVNCSPRLF